MAQKESIKQCLVQVLMIEIKKHHRCSSVLLWLWLLLTRQLMRRSNSLSTNEAIIYKKINATSAMYKMIHRTRNIRWPCFFPKEKDNWVLQLILNRHTRYSTERQLQTYTNTVTTLPDANLHRQLQHLRIVKRHFCFTPRESRNWLASIPGKGGDKHEALSKSQATKANEHHWQSLVVTYRYQWYFDPNPKKIN